MMRPVNLSGLYLSAGSLLQRLLLSWKLDAALHQCRATHAHSDDSRTHGPFFSEYRWNSHICHLRDFGSWRTISDAPTSFLGQVVVQEIYLQCSPLPPPAPPPLCPPPDGRPASIRSFCLCLSADVLPTPILFSSSLSTASPPSPPSPALSLLSFLHPYGLTVQSLPPAASRSRTVQGHDQGYLVVFWPTISKFC